MKFPVSTFNNVRGMPRLTMGIALIAVFAATAAAGCKSDDTSGTTAAKQAGPAGGSVAQTPTPEQEAAKQKAIADGPAIQAAIEASKAPGK